MSSILYMTVASILLAQANLDAQEDRWAGRVQFNLASATGNTENTVLGGNFNIARKFKAITHAIEAGGNYTETTTQDADGLDISNITQNRWFAQYRIEIQTGDASFLYGRTRYEEDQFSGFDRRAFIGGGIGHTLFESEKQNLTFLVGPGLQYFAVTRPDPLPEDFEDTETSVAVFFGETFSRVIAENVTFEQTLDATIADENTTVTNNFALRSNLTQKISLQTAYNIKHETDPPEGREQTDTLLTVSIGYDF